MVAEARAFREKGYNMIIACQPDSQILQQARAADIPTISLRMPKGLSLRTALACARLIRTHHADLIHTHSAPDGWTCGLAARLAGVPVVRSRHLSTPIKRGVISRTVYMRLADRVISSGQSIKDTMVRVNGMRAERIVSIPAGVDVKRFSPDVDATAVKRELGLHDNDFVIGIVAVLRSWKGHQYLIDAVQRLLQGGVPAKLLIVGAGPMEQSLRIRIAELGLKHKIIMTGHRTDVPALIKTMHCMALPSTENEATSQSLPQAMAMKVPVVATNVGGLPEVVTDRKTGLLVPPRDAQALADALMWIYQNPAPAAEMAERGYAHVQANFTFDGMIARTEQVYLTLLNARAA